MYEDAGDNNDKSTISETVPSISTSCTAANQPLIYFNKIKTTANNHT
jgi:hypothetical protein